MEVLPGRDVHYAFSNDTCCAESSALVPQCKAGDTWARFQKRTNKERVPKVMHALFICISR